MKSLLSLIFIGFLFFEGCATPPGKTEQPQAKAIEQTQPQSLPRKKEKVVIIKTARVMKETFLFADGSVDEIRTYLYSTDGKNLLKEELVDAASSEVQETVQYTLNKTLPTERLVLDKEKKLKGKKSFSYLPTGLLESEKLFDKKDALQAVSKYSYDAEGRRIEWLTVDPSGIPLGSTRYSYQGGNVQRISLLNPTGKLDLEIGLVYDDKGKKSRETYVDAAGKTEKEILYGYDSNGRMTSEATLSPGKAVLSKIVYEYTGDSSEPAKINYLDGKDKLKKSVLVEYAYGEEKKVIYE